MIGPARLFTIRARLLILVLLAMTPIVLERISGIQVGRADRVRLTETTARGLAKQGADVFAQTLSSARSLMRAAAVLSEPSDKIDSQTCEKAMKELGSGSEVLDSLSIANSDGRIVCSSLPAFVGVQIGDRDFFKSAIASGDFTVGGMVLSCAYGRPVVPAALSYQSSDGQILSVVVSSLNLAWIETLLSHALDGRNLTASIIDRNGNLIARYPQGEASVGRNLASLDLFKRIASGRFEPFTSADLDGTSRVFAAADLGNQSFFVVGIDRAQIMANIDRQVTVAYAVITAAVLFALLGAVWSSERVILRPLRALADKAVRYGQGNFVVSTSVVKWPPEFVPLNRALEQMAQQLAAREHTLLEENRQLDRLAQVDGLTGVANRRCFDERLRAEWTSSTASGQPLSLIMIDVDYFKRFNDRYGHRAGDSCLRAIATCITRSGLEASNFTARYGGEEFAVVLPSLEPDAALEIAERLRQAVFDLAIENTQSPIGWVTISIGVAGRISDGSHDAGVLIEAADAALYNAKRRGRNVVSGRTSKLVDILAG